MIYTTTRENNNSGLRGEWRVIQSLLCHTMRFQGFLLSLLSIPFLYFSLLYTCFRFGSLLAFPLFFQPNATTINNPTLWLFHTKRHWIPLQHYTNTQLYIYTFNMRISFTRSVSSIPSWEDNDWFRNHGYQSPFDNYLILQWIACITVDLGFFGFLYHFVNGDPVMDITRALVSAWNPELSTNTLLYTPHWPWSWQISFLCVVCVFIDCYSWFW